MESQATKLSWELWVSLCWSMGWFSCEHVYVSTQLKNFYSYKRRYSVTNMAFIGYMKRFMWSDVGARGSTHDSRLLQSCDIYHKMADGHVLPNMSLNLHPYGKITFTTVGDSAFLHSSWFLKPYKDMEQGSISSGISIGDSALPDWSRNMLMECWTGDGGFVIRKDVMYLRQHRHCYYDLHFPPQRMYPE